MYSTPPHKPNFYFNRIILKCRPDAFLSASPPFSGLSVHCSVSHCSIVNADSVLKGTFACRDISGPSLPSGRIQLLTAILLYKVKVHLGKKVDQRCFPSCRHAPFCHHIDFLFSPTLKIYPQPSNAKPSLISYTLTLFPPTLLNKSCFSHPGC